MVRQVRPGNLGRLEAQVWAKGRGRRDTGLLVGPRNPESKSGGGGGEESLGDLQPGALGQEVEVPLIKAKTGVPKLCCKRKYPGIFKIYQVPVRHPQILGSHWYGERCEHGELWSYSRGVAGTACEEKQAALSV